MKTAHLPAEERELINKKNRAWYWANRDSRRATIKSYEERNRAKLQKYRSQWARDAGREYIHGREMKCLYKLTLAEYNAILESQEGLCAICRRPQNWADRWKTKQRRFCVDHDHATGAVRGLLCDRCNLGLSKFDDKKEFLAAALAYLEEHEAETL